MSWTCDELIAALSALPDTAVIAFLVVAWGVAIGLALWATVRQ